MIDDLIYEALEHASKPHNRTMNKIKIYTFTGTVAELKERLAERVKAEKEKEKTPMQLYKEFEKKWDRMTEEYEKDMKILNEEIEKLQGRKVEDIRPFNLDMCDSESDLERGK